MRVVYVSGAIGPNDAGRAARLDRALYVGEMLLRFKFAAVIPHAYCRALRDSDGILDYESWMAIDLALLARCDALFRVIGHSPGADREVARAQELGIPVFDDLHDLLSWRDEALP